MQDNRDGRRGQRQIQQGGDHGGGDARQHGWIRQRRRCRMAKEEMWDDRDVEMGWKDGDRLGKY